ncbi:hypothetical protein CERSUDRAFT_95115 [Gelatoporia subvermispora B]|uniref:Enoyl reductase (ER) domain-containing protein n=1 Tax=Ceriporiopsis subvermispora (strain B) TaxID=914234 RepID=M2QXJ3_CERS8|nr:hypothetical protein CERSUDRAFT_95115 [Gelatoporia subvermispora B]
MKAARYYGPGDIRIEDVPEPAPSRGQLKIKIAWNGICGSDLHAYSAPMPFIPLTKPHPVTGEMVPIYFGHEFSGTVVELGEGVDLIRFRIGQNVAIDSLITCRRSDCYACMNGPRNVCPHVTAIGVSGCAGGLAEYVVLSQDHAHVLPEGIALEVGAMMDPIGVGWHAVNLASLQPGDKSLILGGGPVGLLLIKTLRAHGVSWIAVVEPSKERRRMALELSATAVFDPFVTNVSTTIQRAAGEQGPDVVFDCAGVQNSLDIAIATVRPRGKIISIATWEQKPVFDVNALMAKESSFTAVIGYDNVFPQIIEAMQDGFYDGIVSIITQKIPLEDVIEKGIKTLAQNLDSHIKILVHP